MSLRGNILLGGLCALVGGIVLVAVLTTGGGSVRKYIGDRYTLVSSTGRSATYSSPQSPSVVARSIASKWKPADRRNDPSGYFLRYNRDFVVVTAAEGGGSRIHVDDERRGYARWYPYIGGDWGSTTRPGGGFRGGGPGSGK